MGERKFLNCKILKLNDTLFKLYNASIINLMKELNHEHDESYYQKKMSDMEKFIENGSAVIYIALANETVIGYIWGYERKTEQISRIHVTQFVVEEAYRNNGVGYKLLQEIETWTNEHKFAGIELNVFAQNKGGIDFYLKNGFICKNLIMEKITK